jgi:hypothetical protein
MTTNEAITVFQNLADGACPEGNRGGAALTCTCEAHQAEHQLLRRELGSILLMGLAVSR